MSVLLVEFYTIVSSNNIELNWRFGWAIGQRLQLWLRTQRINYTANTDVKEVMVQFRFKSIKTTFLPAGRALWPEGHAQKGAKHATFVCGGI